MLLGADPFLHRRQHRPILDLFVTQRAMTDLLDQQLPRLLVNLGHLGIRAMPRHEIHPQYPVFHDRIPALQIQTPRHHFRSQQLCRAIWIRLALISRGQHQIAKAPLTARHHTPQARIVSRLITIRKIIGKQFLQPGELDRRCHTEQHRYIAAHFTLLNLSGHK